MASIKNLLRTVYHRLMRHPASPIYAQISYTSPSSRLAGKKIVITGGGRGLGFAMAKKCVQEGAEVLIAGRKEETLRKSAAELGCAWLTLDVGNVDSFDNFLQQADERLGGINALVNNAGISLHEPTLFDVTKQTFDAQIATNFRGPYFLSQRFIALMLQRKQAAVILFTSSETGETADMRPYGFTKAAINSMVKGLANLFAKEGIRINAVAPGITTSDMTGFKAEGNLACPGNTLGRVYLPEEVAEVACFLLSDTSGCLSGQIITCNNAKTVNPRW